MSAPTCRPTHVALPIVVMGVCGAGKSVIGAQLADVLGLPFLDGDDLHPAANVTKMSQGLSLTDEDRKPWLAAVGSWLTDHRSPGAVTACSALKRSYRDQLRTAHRLHPSGRRPAHRHRPSGIPPGPFHAAKPCRLAVPDPGTTAGRRDWNHPELRPTRRRSRVRRQSMVGSCIRGMIEGDAA